MAQVADLNHIIVHGVEDYKTRLDWFNDPLERDWFDHLMSTSDIDGMIKKALQKCVSKRTLDDLGPSDTSEESGKRVKIYLEFFSWS